MSDRPTAALTEALERMVALVAGDRELRAAVRAVCESILAATEEPEEATIADESAPDDKQAEPAGVIVPAGVAEPAGVVGAAKPIETLPAPKSPAEPPASLPELDIGSAVEPAPAVEVEHTAKTAPVLDAELTHIEARCRLKAEGARWAATRQRRLRSGADFYTEIEPKDRELITRAKEEHECFLWMNHPSGPTPQDLSLMDDVAACFENLAGAISVVRQVIDNPDEYGDIFERSLDLVAEAHSALRVAAGRIDGPQDDDQVKTHRWLRRVTSEEHIFIQRYMRMNDPADPRTWPDIQSRIEALDDELQETRRLEKQRRNRIKKVRYHVHLIQSNGGSDHDWQTIIKTVDDMLADGMPPSSREVRETLLPVVEDLPDEMPISREFQLVLQEIDRYLVSRPPQLEQQTQEPTPEVSKVAELLANKSIFMIGGERRPYAKQAIEDAFKLGELIWPTTDEHESIDRFEPFVARDDVAVVLLAIRWSSHSYGEVVTFCERYDKPLVRLPGGYSPNQVAHQILTQCGERLGEERLGP